MVLPALAGLLITLLSRLRYVSKWGALHMAALMTESEIYKFRAKAADYDLMQTATFSNKKEKKGGQKEKAGDRTEMRNPAKVRSLFVTRTSAIFQGVLSSEM